MDTIGKKLRKLIMKSKIKQTDLAKHLGISTSRLSNYLSDKREPDIQMLSQIAHYLSVDLNYFSDIRFSGGKTSGLSASDEQHVPAVKSPSAVNVPYFTINSKKRSLNTAIRRIVQIDRIFLEYPEDSVVFEVTTMIDEYFSIGDYIIAVKLSCVDNVENGAIVLEMGRSGKIHRYINYSGEKFLVSLTGKEVRHMPSSENNYYMALRTIRCL